EDEFGVAAPRREQRVLEARAGHALEVDGGDDLVGVDVRATQRDADAGVGRELLHGSSFASVATPVPIRTRPRPRGRPGWTRCRAPRWPPRRAATRGGCGRPCPGDLQSCGWTSTRCAPAERAGRGSCP